MRALAFGISTVLTLAGISFAVIGITKAEWKLTAIGLVLIFGAGVFATLYLGTRRTSGNSAETMRR